MPLLELTPEDIDELETCEEKQTFEQLLRCKGFNDTFINFIVHVYSFATSRKFGCSQKQILVNTSIAILSLISHISTDKMRCIKELQSRVSALSRPSQDYKMHFTIEETEAIHKFLSSEILDYYQLYEKILDKSPLLKIQSKGFEPVPVIAEQQLGSGTIVEVEGVATLKEFVGIRQPKEEKKEAKKK